jgi:hypothetical protein
MRTTGSLSTMLLLACALAACDGVVDGDYPGRLRFRVPVEIAKRDQVELPDTWNSSGEFAGILWDGTRGFTRLKNVGASLSEGVELARHDSPPLDAQKNGAAVGRFAVLSGADVEAWQRDGALDDDTILAASRAEIVWVELQGTPPAAHPDADLIAPRRVHALRGDR